jgi:hypothetical protein
MTWSTDNFLRTSAGEDTCESCGEVVVRLATDSIEGTKENIVQCSWTSLCFRNDSLAECRRCWHFLLLALCCCFAFLNKDTTLKFRTNARHDFHYCVRLAAPS